MTRILFVDDEPYYAQHYVRRLEDTGYKVTLCDSAESGLQRLRDEPGAFKLLILDFMMPTPTDVLPAETDDGLATGRWFLRSARALLDKSGMRVIVLTNRAADAVTKIVEQDVKFDMKRVRICHKTQTPAFYLPTILKMLLD